MGLTIVVGADIAGVNYKETLKADLEADERVTKVIDVGVSPGQDIDYPGMGMAIAANKVPGIRASVAHDSFSVERLVLSNDAQVLTLGERVIGLQLARRLVREWLGYTFDPSSSSGPKVTAISSYEPKTS